MASYGNILIVSEEAKSADILSVLKSLELDTAIFNTSYFIETTSMDNTRDLVKRLEILEIEFVFFHNHISDGSQVVTQNIDKDLSVDINRILLKQ